MLRVVLKGLSMQQPLVGLGGYLPPTVALGYVCFIFWPPLAGLFHVVWGNGYQLLALELGCFPTLFGHIFNVHPQCVWVRWLSHFRPEKARTPFLVYIAVPDNYLLVATTALDANCLDACEFL